MSEDITCGKCGRRVEPGAFCEHCGAPLAAATRAATDNDIPHTAAPPPNIPAAAATPHSTPASHQAPPGAAAATPARAAEQPKTKAAETTTETRAAAAIAKMDERVGKSMIFSAASTTNSDCDDLELQVDIGRIFVGGATFPLRVRLLPRGAAPANISVEVSTQTDAGIIRAAHSIERLKPFSGPREFSLDITMPQGVHGEKTFRWQVAYELDGAHRRFEAAPTRHTIYPPEESASKFVENLSISISQGHASDVSMDGIAEKLNNLRGRDFSVREFLAENRNLPVIWESLPLYESDSPSLSPPPPAAMTPRVTLAAGGRRLHLLAPPLVILGRARQADLTTRNFSPSGTAESALNEKISRFHCRLECGMPPWGLVDGGITPGESLARGSAHGTYIDGARLGRGFTPFPRDRRFSISLGGHPGADPRIFTLEGELVSCSRLDWPDCPVAARCGREAIACLVLRRCDAVPELYAVVNHCLPAGMLLPALGNLRVWRHRDAFACHGGGRFQWLVPGTAIATPGGGQIEVAGFHQHGV